MFEKIKSLFSFPCQARLDAVQEKNRMAHERLRKACEGAACTVAAPALRHSFPPIKEGRIVNPR